MGTTDSFPQSRDLTHGIAVLTLQMCCYEVEDKVGGGEKLPQMTRAELPGWRDEPKIQVDIGTQNINFREVIIIIFLSCKNCCIKSKISSQELSDCGNTVLLVSWNSFNIFNIGYQSLRGFGKLHSIFLWMCRMILALVPSVAMKVYKRFEH